MSRGEVVVRNTASLALGQGLTWALSIVYWIIVPRVVGPADWGSLSLAGAVTGVAVSVAGLGMGTLITKDLARDLSRTREYVGAALVAQAILTVPLLLIVGGTVVVARYPATTVILICLLTLGTVIGFLGSPIKAALLAHEKMHVTAFGDVVGNGLASLAAVVFLMLLDVGIVGIALVGVIAALIVGVFELYALSRVVTIRLSFSFQMIRYLIVGGLPYWALGLFLTFYLWIDSVVLSFLAPVLVVGWYGAVTRLFATLLFVPTIIGTALFPLLAYSFQHERDNMRQLIRRGFTLITSFSVPIAVGTALLSTNIVYELFGVAYAPAAPVLAVLAVTVIPTYINITLSTTLACSDRQNSWTAVMGVACVLNPLINIATIWYCQSHLGNGALGAAIALLITEVVQAAAAIWLIGLRTIGWQPFASIIRSAIATAIMAVGVWYLRDQFVLIPMTVGAVIFFLAAAVLRVFPREDVLLVGELFMKIARKLGLRYRLRSTATERAAGLPPTMLDLFTDDLSAWKRIGYLGDPVAYTPLKPREVLRLLWTFTPVRATLVLRLSTEAERLRIPMLPRVLARFNLRHYGLDIVPGIPIGGGLYIPHPVGVVIMARAIGRNCQIISAVTIGMRNRWEFPTLGDDVFVGAGARILGGIVIGDGAQIGANAVVVHDVPTGATAVGIPARVRGQRGSERRSHELLEHAHA